MIHRMGGSALDERPIGVFDSGLGGLTTVRELCRLLPEEDIVYFGDTGGCPTAAGPGRPLSNMPGRTWPFCARLI